MPSLSDKLTGHTEATEGSKKRRKLQEGLPDAPPVRSEDKPLDYAAQLANKISRIDDIFKDVQRPDLEVFESLEEHYRLRWRRFCELLTVCCYELAKPQPPVTLQGRVQSLAKRRRHLLHNV